jgi:hypothetical protein
VRAAAGRVELSVEQSRNVLGGVLPGGAVDVLDRGGNAAVRPAPGHALDRITPCPADLDDLRQRNLLTRVSVPDSQNWFRHWVRRLTESWGAQTAY